MPPRAARVIKPTPKVKEVTADLIAKAKKKEMTAQLARE